MSIKRQFAASSFWIVLGNGANNLVSFLIFVVLARLLDPSTIGLVAFALIFIDLGRIVVFGGLPEAVVQRKEWSDEVGSTCFTANLLTAIVFFALVAGVVAPLISAYYMPDAGPVLSSLAAIYVIDAARAVHEAKLRREFRYKPLAARMSVATAISGVIGIGLAFAGYGVWSLVVQRLVNAVILTLLTWTATRWVPRLHISTAILRELSGFIIHLTPARLLTVFTSKVAEFAVGLVLGPAAIAFYRVGARGLEVIAQLTVAPIQQAALSAFSRMPNVSAIGGAYARVTRVSAVFAGPVYFGSAVIAPDFIRLVFGPQWQQSGPIMAALALAVGSTTLGYFIQPALTAAGRPKLVLLSTAWSCVATMATAASTVWYGPVAVAAGNTVLQYASLPFRLRMLSGALQLDWRRAVGGVLPAILASAGMALTVLAVRVTLLDGLDLLVRFGISAVVGAIVYPLLLMLFARGHMRELLDDIAPLVPPAIARRLTRARSSSGSEK